MYASDYRRIARQNLSGHWLISAFVCFIASLLGGISTGSSVDINAEDLKTLMSIEGMEWIVPVLSAIMIYCIIAAIVSFVIGGVIELGLHKFFLKQYNGEEYTISDLFSQFFNFGGGFCLRLLTGIYTVLWTMLFIIPGIIKSYSYAMAPYIMVEHPEWGANECITRSREMMNGHKFELFCLELSFIGWAILSIFTLGIGNLFLTPYTQAARTAFYRNLRPVELRAEVITPVETIPESAENTEE